MDGALYEVGQDCFGWISAGLTWEPAPCCRHTRFREATSLRWPIPAPVGWRRTSGPALRKVRSPA